MKDEPFPWTGEIIDRWTEKPTFRVPHANGEHVLVADMIDGRFVRITHFSREPTTKVWMVGEIIDLDHKAFAAFTAYMGKHPFVDE